MATKPKTIKHRPATWMKLTGIMVLDPDGWRGANYQSFYKPIDQEEWIRRQQTSTCTLRLKQSRIYCPHCGFALKVEQEAKMPQLIEQECSKCGWNSKRGPQEIEKLLDGLRS